MLDRENLNKLDFEKLRRKYGRDDANINELFRIWSQQEIAAIHPNVYLTLTDYCPDWRPSRWQNNSHLERFRRRLCRFLKWLFKALCGAESDPDEWPSFDVMIETISAKTNKQVMPHASIALCLTERQKAILGEALGRRDNLNARSEWLKIIGAHKPSANDRKGEGFKKEEKYKKLFDIDCNPKDSSSFYITKFSGIENNINYSIKKSDLLCVIGRQKRKSH